MTKQQRLSCYYRENNRDACKDDREYKAEENASEREGLNAYLEERSRSGRQIASTLRPDNKQWGKRN
jgi:hypothetical protein